MIKQLSELPKSFIAMGESASNVASMRERGFYLELNYQDFIRRSMKLMKN